MAARVGSMVVRWLIRVGKRASEATHAPRSWAIGLRVAALCLLCGFGLTGIASAAQLQQVTIQAFGHYVALTEDRMAGEIRDPGGFLWIDRLPAQSTPPLFAQLRRGQVITQNPETFESGHPIPIPHGMVHHWLALVFVPGVHLAQVLAQQQNFDRCGQVYGPDLQRCSLLQAHGNDFRVYYRLHRKVIVTVTYNADFDIQFVPIDTTRAYSRSYSARIAEVIDADLPDEREKPVGTDLGYLWRLNTYTRYQERDGGVYIQTEFIALSRSVPAIFAWLVNPYVRSVPQDYLVHILGATRGDLMNTKVDAAQAAAGRERAVQASTPSLPGRPTRTGRARNRTGAAVNTKGY
jgi:hypothetical protein